MELEVNGKLVNLKGTLPLTLGDLRALKKHDIRIDASLDMTDPDTLHTILLHLFQKANKDVVEGDLDGLTIHHLRDIGDYIQEQMKVIDRPL